MGYLFFFHVRRPVRAFASAVFLFVKKAYSAATRADESVWRCEYDFKRAVIEEDYSPVLASPLCFEDAK